MEYTHHYNSALGVITLSSRGTALTGLWFEGQRYYLATLEHDHQEMDLPVFDAAMQWLDIYFSGKKPDFTPALSPEGTVFQKSVWRLLLTIPYGHTVSYGQLAKEIASSRGLASMSAQAVGAAISRNPISIIIPCHRVIASNGNLTGYAGGLYRKQQLLNLEQASKR